MLWMARMFRLKITLRLLMLRIIQTLPNQRNLVGPQDRKRFPEPPGIAKLPGVKRVRHRLGNCHEKNIDIAKTMIGVTLRCSIVIDNCGWFCGDDHIETLSDGISRVVYDCGHDVRSASDFSNSSSLVGSITEKESLKNS